MVHRQLTAAAAAALCALCALASAPSAEAINQRISISDYQWSAPDIDIDLGENVTWYWTGPDVVHSVTGEPPNAAGMDSDPGNNLPHHPVGDSFRIAFTQPGVYRFRCKLHTSVGGTVTVSSAPGDPNGEPAQPVPKNNVDLKAPKLRELSLASKAFRGAGGELRFSLGERSKVEAEYFSIERRNRRRYAGWAKWKAHVGFNNVRLGARGKNFDARPGRYVAVLRAIDGNNNTSPSRSVRFRIRAAKG